MAKDFSYFISKRIRTNATGRFSATIQRIAIGSIAVGLAVMIVSQFILGGFRATIQEKIFSFGAHVLVTKYSNTNSYDENPVNLDNHLYFHPEEYEYVA
ncbi:MAG: ABC transporter permease, partial [Bacteroidota bacterium]